MATIFVHVGQCGNQLGIPFWKNIVHSNSDTIFHSLDGFQRSVHIDSEPKVVKSIQKMCKIRERNVILGKRGRGTNFALGYHGMNSSGDDHVLEKSLESMRKEIERCDSYNGTVIYHSLSGGTGAGLGAHLIECLRDDYPCASILSCAIAPCISGESPLQSYNALLTLHWLQSFCDAVLFLQNDLLIEYAKKFLPEESDKCKVSFQDINKVAADNLCGLFLPTDTLSTRKGIKLGQEPWELSRTLAATTMTKFLSISQHSSSKLSWGSMASKACRQIPKYDKDQQLTKALSATVVARGDPHESFLSEAKQNVERKLKQGLHFVDWNPYPLDFWTAKYNALNKKSNSSVSIAVNSSCVVDHFSTVMERAHAKLSVGAYMQWYQRYGMDNDIFEESLETLQDVISQYRTAIH